MLLESVVQLLFREAKVRRIDPRWAPSCRSDELVPA